MSEQLARDLSDFIDDVVGARVAPGWAEEGGVGLLLTKNEAQRFLDALRKSDILGPLIVPPLEEDDDEAVETWTFARTRQHTVPVAVPIHEET